MAVAPLAWAAAASLATLAGGVLAIRARERLPLVLGLGGGVLLGVVAFDLLPECLAAAGPGEGRVPALLACAAGFALCHLVQSAGHARSRLVAPGALIAHSVADGAGIALAFQASPEAGIAVALAVIAHDLCDGIALAGVLLLQGGGRARALALLAVDAAAPLAGAMLAGALALPPASRILVPGVLAGFLLYLAAVELLPAAWRVAAGR